MWEMPRKIKRKTATLLTRCVEGAKVCTILRTIVSQKHTYDKGETISPRPPKSEKIKLVQSWAKKLSQISLRAWYVNAAYRTETESEQELYLYTVKENNWEEIFTNIDCVDSGGDKHKIKMKVDTGANGNIIPLKIYKKKKRCTHVTPATKWENRQP